MWKRVVRGRIMMGGRSGWIELNWFGRVADS